MPSWGARRIGVSCLQTEPSAGGFRWLPPPLPVLLPPLGPGAETFERGHLRGSEGHVSAHLGRAPIEPERIFAGTSQAAILILGVTVP